MIRITDPSQCCGCTACASVCPHDAITMQPDVMGFLYPSVDSEKCIDCGLCEKVCAFNGNYDKSLNLPLPEAYAARHKEMQEVETSRSGAAFIAISDWVLQNDGVVYGAGYADHFRVVHKRATTKDERDEFKGSKYVQSYLGHVFKQVKRDLKDGKIVLFSGTPCQTSGLNSYIGRRLRENLYLVDIVCHGVPAPYLWRDYLAYLEKKQGDRVCRVNFRDKQEFGWTAHHETFTFSDKSKMSTNTYTDLFFQHIMFRKSCAVCPFTNVHRPSDITLADFWGWEKLSPDLNNDDKGLSLVFVNSDKGKRLFEVVRCDLNVHRVYDINLCLQPNLRHPSIPHPKRNDFEHDYAKHGFEYVAKKYGDMGWRYKLRILKRKASTAKRLFLKKVGI